MNNLANNAGRKLSSYFAFFIALFVLVVFTHAVDSDKHINPPVKVQKESVLFVDEANSAINYISMRISRTKVFEIFMSRDTLPQFIKKSEMSFIFHKIIHFAEKAVKLNFSYSILQRYRERILLI